MKQKTHTHDSLSEEHSSLSVEREKTLESFYYYPLKNWEASRNVEGFQASGYSEYLISLQKKLQRGESVTIKNSSEFFLRIE